VEESLNAMMLERKIEFATLVDRNLTIVAGANNNRVNETWDPSGVVSKVLALNTRIIVSTTMEWSEFMKEGAIRWL
jgi:twitching motility protein PilJ